MCLPSAWHFRVCPPLAIYFRMLYLCSLHAQMSSDAQQAYSVSHNKVDQLHSLMLDAQIDSRSLLLTSACHTRA